MNISRFSRSRGKCLVLVLVMFLFGVMFRTTYAQFQPLNSIFKGVYNSNTGNITYKVDWQANVSLANSKLTASVPPGTTFISANSGGVLNEKIVTWDLGTLDVGQSGSRIMTVSVDAAKSLNLWGATVVEFSQGTTKSGSPIAPEFSNAQKVLESPDGNFLALGFKTGSNGGSVIISFSLPIVNGPGNDVSIVSSSKENLLAKAFIEGSNDQITWVPLGSITGSGEVEIGQLSSAKYIRITDISDKNLFSAGDQGYLVDAVQNLHLDPLSCNLISLVKFIGSSPSGLVELGLSSQVNIVPNCAAEASSGLSGLGNNSGLGGGGFGGSSTTTPGSSGGGGTFGGGGNSGGGLPTGNTNSGGGGGSIGGGESIGGPSSGGVMVPKGKVAGVATGTPLSDIVRSVVEGSSKKLPVTGQSPEVLLIISVVVCALFITKKYFISFEV